MERKKSKNSRGKAVKTEVKDCHFTGVHWDADAVRSVEMVAQGLLNLTELFRSQNIKIDSLLKFEGN